MQYKYLLHTAEPNTRSAPIQLAMWQMGGAGPMFCQVGFFNKFAGRAYEDKRQRDHPAIESARLLGVLNERGLEVTAPSRGSA